jgi:RHS repeat-associated protein
LTVATSCAGTGCTQTEETYSYNNRLQFSRVELGTSSNNNSYDCLVYNYYAGGTVPTGCALYSAGTQDNGSVAGYHFVDHKDTTQSHTAACGYDGVNRLTSASASPSDSGTVSYSQSFNFTGDGSTGQFGNVSCSVGGSGICPQVTFDPATNRVLKVGSASASYDAAGDMTGDGTSTYQWDAEQRLSSVNSGSTAAFVYNALGERVETQAGATYHEFVYDPAGSPVARHDRGSSFFWQYLMLGEQAFGKYQDGVTYFMHWNALGSTSMVTDQTGAVVQDILYYPFGAKWTQTGSKQNKDLHFAGTWQEPEGGLNDTLFRKYNTTLGRWMSPDPLGGDISNPQSLNRYAYAGNNPTTLTDPLGLCTPGQDCHPPSCTNMNCVWGTYGWEVAQFCGLPGYPCVMPATQQEACMIDGLPGSCSQAIGMLQSGSANLAQPPGYVPVSAGAQSGCPGCYWNPNTDETWDPNADNPVLDLAVDSFNATSIQPAVLVQGSPNFKPDVPPTQDWCGEYRNGTGGGEILDTLCMHLLPFAPNSPYSNCVRGKLLNQWPTDSVPRYLFIDHPKDFYECYEY